MLKWNTQSTDNQTETACLQLDHRTELQAEFRRTWSKNYGALRLARDGETENLEQSYNDPNLTTTIAQNLNNLRILFRSDMEETRVKFEAMEIIQCQMQNPDIQTDSKKCKHCKYASKCWFMQSTGKLPLVFLNEDLKEDFSLRDVIREAIYQFDIKIPANLEEQVTTRLKIACQAGLKNKANKQGKYPRSDVFELLHNDMWLYFATLAQELKSKQPESEV